MLRTCIAVAIGLVIVVSLLSCGDNPEGSSENLSVTVTAPPSEGAAADQTYTIQWESSNASGSASVSLFYDTDVNPSNGLTQIVIDQSPSGTYTWDCASVNEGDYYIRAVISETGSSASDYSDGALTIEHEGGPSITVYTPPAGGAMADSTYGITWQSTWFDSTATVDLYYDTDTVPSSGLQEIALDLSDDGEHEWDCSSVDEGEYYVYAIIEGDTLKATASDYSSGILLIDHTASAPEITITQPSASGDQADNFFTIEWTSLAPLGSVVDLYYDTDTLTGSGLVEIVTGVADDGYYSWNCGAVPEGDYYIYGVITTMDGRRVSAEPVRTAFRNGGRSQGADYSDGVLTISHESNYSIEITAPPAGGAAADTSYTVQWTSDAPAGESIDLFYSADTTGSELLVIQEELTNTGSYQWDCSGVEEGIYYVFGVVGEGRGIGSDWSDGQITITHEDEYYFTFTAPPPSGATADEEYLLQWDTDAPDSTTYVSLYYSDTQGGGALQQIVSGELNLGEYSWDCSTLAEDEYWFWGIVSDDRDEVLYVRPESDGSGSAWSEGSVTVTHSTYSMEVTAPPAGGATADSAYTIEWTAQGGTGSVVDLYYDTDTIPGSGLVDIATGLSNSGSYSWNTVAVPEGSYYVYAIIYDPTFGRPDPGRFLTDASAADYSDGPLTIAHSYFFVDVIAPPPWGAQAEDQYTIQWAAEAPSGSTIDLAYDTDTNPSSGLVSITSGLAWDDFQYDWDCSTTPEGEYYIYALLDDGAGTTTYDYSDGTLVIDRNPLWLWITEPNPGGAVADDTFDIEWMSQGPVGRTIDLYYDEDTEPSSGLVLIIDGLVTENFNDLYTWNCSAVPEGDYYIYGVLKDPVMRVDSVTHYSEGTVTISH